MTKKEFVGKVAQKSGLSNRDAGKAVDAFIDSITETLKSGDSVSFTGFGKFLSQRRRARQGVNPQNPSQKIRISAATVPKFRPGASLRAAVAQTPADARAGSASGDREPAESAEPAGWKPLGRRK